VEEATTGAEVAPEVVPEVAPEVGPEVTPEVVPEVAPEVVPEVAPEVGPEVAPEVVPEVAPEVGPEVAPEVVPEVAPEVGPEVTPEVDAPTGPEAEVTPEVVAEDKTPPTVTITEPANNATISGALVKILGTATDSAGPAGAAPSGVAELSISGVPIAIGEGGAFSHALTGAKPGPLTITVEAKDKAGNLGTATVNLTVEELLLGLAVAPVVISMNTVGQKVPLEVQGLYDGAQTKDLTAQASFKSSQPGVALVNPQGVVTALSTGQTKITATYKAQSKAVDVIVVIDTTPPAPPNIATYVPSTDLETQVWMGITEPGATLEISGAAKPVKVTADAKGEFLTTLEVTPGVNNNVQVIAVDAAGNASDPYPFPIKQSPSTPDSGAVHIASGDQQQGTAGQVLIDPIVVRVTDQAGKALLDQLVEFSVTSSEGQLLAAADATPVGGPGEPAVLLVKTDGQGYAKVWWRLDPAASVANRAAARLAGDTGLPSLFSATGLPPVKGGGTTIEGLVLDDARAGVVGATIHLMGSVLSTMTDDRGRFTLEYGGPVPDPAGPGKVIVLVDGSTAAVGSGYHATITFEVPVVPHQRNRIVRPFFVPFIPEGVELKLDAQNRVTETVIISRQFDPDVPPTKVTLAKGTKVTWPPGLADSKKKVAVIDIPMGQIPMPLPDGLFSEHVIAVQPANTLYDPPLKVELPNVDGIGPGQTVPMLQFDHDVATFKQVGTATVSTDGAYLVSDPGSGILKGAWYPTPPQEPPSTCCVTGSVESTAGRAENCVCLLSTGQVMPCSPGNNFRICNLPCTGDQTTNIQVVRVVCEGEKKPIRIVEPHRQGDQPKVVPLGHSVSLRAETLPPGAEGPAKWTVNGTEVGSGASTSKTFEAEGVFNVTVSCNNTGGGDEQECVGSDSIMVEVKTCCETGSLRVCGDKVEETVPADAPDGPQYDVTGGVTLGMGGEQYLRVGDGPVKCNLAEKEAEGSGDWRMDTRIPVIGLELPNHHVYAGEWKVNGVNGEAEIAKPGKPGQLTLEFLGFKFNPPDQPVTVGIYGINIKAPEFDYGLEFGEDQEINIKWDSVDILTTSYAVGGTFTYEGEFPPGPGVLKVIKLEVGYQPAINLFKGAFGLKIGPPGKSWELEIGGEYQNGHVRRLSFEGDLPSPLLIAKGLPITAATPVVFLRKLRGSVDWPGYWFGDVPPAGEQPKIGGGLQLGLGPSGEFAVSTFCAKYGLAIIDVDGEIALAPWGFKGSVEGALAVVNSCGEEGSLEEDGLFSLKSELEIESDPFKGKLTGAFKTNNFTNNIRSLGLLPGFIDKLIEDEELELDTEDMVSAEASLSVTFSPSFTAGISASAALKTPAVKIFGFGFGSSTIANASFEFQFQLGPPLTASVSAEGAIDYPLFPAFDFAVRFSTSEGFDISACVDLGALFGRRCLGSIEIERRPFEGEGSTFVVSQGVDAIEIALIRTGDELAFDLLAPDGTLLDSGDPDTLQAAGMDGIFLQDLPLGHSTWLIAEPPAGTWAIMNLTGSASELIVALPDAPPAVALLEPFTADGKLVKVGFFAADPESDATVIFAYTPTGDAGDQVSIAEVKVSDAKTEIAWDTLGVRAGAYFVCATAADQATHPVRVCSKQPVVVEPGELLAGLAAPRLVRAAHTAAGLEVSWLPGSGAEAGWFVRARPVGGDAALEQGIDPSRTRYVFAEASKSTDYLVTVTALGGEAGEGPESEPLRLASATGGGLVFSSVPIPMTRAGDTWVYATAATGGGGLAKLVLVEAPNGMIVQGKDLWWTPSAEQQGRHAITITGIDAAGGTAALQHFTLTVAPTDAVSRPVFLSEPGAEAKIGQLFNYKPAAKALMPADNPTAPLTLTLVDGPDGMVLGQDGTLTWTPTAEQVSAAKGALAFTLEAKGPTGLSATQARLIRVADSDGDGLLDDYERPSGLDPYQADIATADADKDGLSHTKEQEGGTLGNTDDSDGDGLKDGAESALGSSPRAKDTDFDGMDDSAELAAGTDPVQSDTDGDGVSDAEEAKQGSDPAKPAVDTDQDGLSDDQEQKLGTNPNAADIDQDGLDDKQETALGTNPGYHDTDGDGVSDGEESQAGRDPKLAGQDSDEDGLFDDFEVVHGTDPQRLDSDGDGFDDGTELAAGFKPNDKASKPGIPPGQKNAPTTLKGASPATVFPPNQVVDVGKISVIRDDDNDTVPNQYELDYQFDPFDSADGNSDTDADGLTLKAEYQFQTDPTKADSDNDGVSDGQEVKDGTDPNDNTSFGTGGPVVTLLVTPDEAMLTSNTIFGPAGLQLEVTGVREDGSKVDLHWATKGTTYLVQPANLALVTADGQVVHILTAGEGQVTVTVTQGELTATAKLTFEVFTPGPIKALQLPGTAGPLGVAGTRAVVMAQNVAQMVDLRLPEEPAIVAGVDLGTEIAAVDVLSSRAVAISTAGDLFVLNVKDLQAPSLTARIPLGSPGRSVALDLVSGRAFAGTDKGLLSVNLDGGGGIGLFDLNDNKVDDRILGTQISSESVRAVDVSFGRVAAGTQSGKVYAYNNTAGVLAAAGQADVNGAVSGILSMGSQVYVVAFGQVRRVNLSESPPIVDASSVGGLQPAGALDAYEDHLALARNLGSGMVSFLATGLPDSLPLDGQVNFTTLDPNPGVSSARDMAIEGQYHFVTASGSGQNWLLVGRHDKVVDLLGKPPVVSLLSPDPNGSYPEGSKLTYAVSATDDVEVAKVELLVDGALAATLQDPPYETTLALPDIKGPTTVTLTATATDVGGNVGTMEPATFKVVPVIDLEPPKVALITPYAGQIVSGGLGLPVKVAVTDDIGVADLRILLDGQTVVVDSLPPYDDNTILIPLQVGTPDKSMTLTVRVTDIGENTTEKTVQLVHGGTDLVALGVTAIGASDLTYDGVDVFVGGGTVAITGVHAFGRVSIGDGGVLTHAATGGSGTDPKLEILADEVVVTVGGRIDVTGKGYLGACAPPNGCSARTLGNSSSGAWGTSGGSHAGWGAGGNVTAIYGDAFAPTTLGSGGAYGATSNNYGGSGGGVIRITAGVLTVDGAILADGGAPFEAKAPLDPGGGSGGSIWIDVGKLSGKGVIHADGGAGGSAGKGGGGAGGRIALIADEVDGFEVNSVHTFAGASGPDQTLPGTPGSLYFLLHNGDPELVIDDGGTSAHREAEPIETSYTGNPIGGGTLVLTLRGDTRTRLYDALDLKALRLEETAILSLANSTTTWVSKLDITAQTIDVAVGTVLDAKDRGYLGACESPNGCEARGLGNVKNGSSGYSGGSHGGRGEGQNYNDTYDDPLAPIYPGSGGAYGQSGTNHGGNGGGQVVVQVGVLTLDGQLNADGGDFKLHAAATTSDGGGGGGGAIDLTATTLTGTGLITARGGAGGTLGNGGDGGGGRVKITVEDATGFDLDAQVSARGAIQGAPGTVYLVKKDTTPKLLIEDGGTSAFRESAPFGNSQTGTGFGTGIDIEIRGQSRVLVWNALEPLRLTLAGQAQLGQPPTNNQVGGETSLTIKVQELTVEPEAELDGYAKGYLGACAPSNGCNARTFGNTTSGGAGQDSGGSHGGRGGGPNPPATYGNWTQPVTLGAGGGYGITTQDKGGSGGGRAWIEVSGTFTLEGTINMNGGDATSDKPSGQAHGGAGGSVYISAAKLVGGGTVEAHGGDGGTELGSVGGSGGRVAILSPDANGFTGKPNLDVLAGSGTKGVGAPGTLYLALDGATPSLVIDDMGQSKGLESGAFGTVSTGAAILEGLDVTIGGTSRIVVYDTLKPKSLTLTGEAVLTHTGTSTTTERALIIDTGTLTVDPTATIDVSGRGYLGGSQSGNSSQGDTYKLANGSDQLTGGSHATLGGGPFPASVYGDPFAPVTLGGGGGRGSDSQAFGGSGGGRVRITATTLKLEGKIRASGQAGFLTGTANGGGGAGGSIYVTAGTLSGVGSMEAHGGAGGLGTDSAGGAGGRIAVVYTTLGGFDPAKVTAHGGTGFLVHGGPGTVALRTAGGETVLRLDNEGIVQSNYSAAWWEVGHQQTSSITADTLNFNNNYFLADTLVGLRVGFETTDQTFTVLSNTANAIKVDTSHGTLIGAGVTATARLTGWRDLGCKLILAGGTRLMLVDAVTMDRLEITTGALLRHPRATTSGLVDRGLHVEVANGVAIDATSMIDVSELGYAGSCQNGFSCGQGYSYGNSATWGGGYSTGGSHGGGGGSAAESELGQVYGDPIQPTTLGAGGGRSPNSPYDFGGWGGGRVYLEAATVNLEGAIRADGGAPFGTKGDAGGGAGGSIWLQVGSLSGQGEISANGGPGGSAAVAGGGSGGRIAVYGDATGFTGTATSFGGTAGQYPGNAGTVVFKDAAGNLSLVIDNNGVAYATSIETSFVNQMGVHRVSTVTSSTITLEGSPGLPTGFHVGRRIGCTTGNGSGPEHSFTIVSHTANVLSFDTVTDNPLTANVQGGNKDRCWGIVEVPGHLILRGGAASSLWDRLQVASLTVEGGGYLTAQPVYTSPVAEPWLHVTASDGITIAADGSLDVSGRGYRGAQQATASDLGFTNGNTGSVAQRKGGSHGGIGGGAIATALYDDALKPVLPGAGGGRGAVCCSRRGGNGGGRIYLTADVLLIDGLVLANGSGADATYDGGGGAGGSVWLQASILAGKGTLRADGGAGGDGTANLQDAQKGGGGGGGGRIAWSVTDSASWLPALLSVAAGASGPGATAASVGTTSP
jgi:hypothetical protein